jgi:hypothetical protein
LKSISIPRNVDFIDGSAFAGCEWLSVTVDPNNERFSTGGEFLINDPEKCLVRYFGHSREVQIWKDIEILGQSCFQECKQLEVVTFHEESRLKRIEDSCFKNSSLKSICFPRNAEIIGKWCFSGCQELNEVILQSEP